MLPHLSLPVVDQLLAHRNWRTDWTLERTCLYWYLTFDDEPELAALFEELTPGLRRIENVDAVPADWLHLTVLEVGYADEVVRSDVAAMVAAAETIRDLMPLRLDLGPVSTMTDAVVLGVHPSPEVLAVRATLAEGLGTLRRPHDEGFWPHVSIGYLNTDCRREEVMAAFENVVPRTVSVTVPRLTLAAVTRLETHYQWQSVARLPTGQP
ncbi:MAG: 2'-5' RNA ligase family protein [Marmoricola sp.]